MFCRLAILVALLALCRVSHTLCSFEHSAEAHLNNVKIFVANNDSSYEGQARYAAGLRIPRASRAVYSVEMLAMTSVLIVLFLFLQCVTFISGSFWANEGSERRLAGGNSCEDVSFVYLATI